MAKKRTLVQQEGNPFLYLIFPVILLAPFFRGLFFDDELLVAHIFSAAVFGAFLYVNRDRLKVPDHIMDYAGLGLIAAYMISFFAAYNPRDAVGEIFKLTNYVIVFWLVSRLARGLKGLQQVMLLLFTAGVGVALAGLGTAFGTFTFNGAFVEGLINSTLQYHNAAAIYLIAATIVGLYLSVTLENHWLKIVVSGANYVIFVTAFGAGSRGAMLIGMAVYVMFFIGFPNALKKSWLANMLLILLPFAVTAKPLLNFGVNTPGLYWLILLGGFAAASAGQFAMHKFSLRLPIAGRNLALAAGIIAVVVIGGLFFVGGEKVMPTTIAARLQNISLNEGNLQERLYFYKDAFKMFRDHPIIGTGGGGWTSGYRSYQSYLYHTTEVHNGPLQVLVESGIIGFAFLVLLWIGAFYAAFRVITKAQSAELKAAAWTAFAGALAIGLHGVMDFSLSLGAVAIMMWTLLGLLRSCDNLCTAAGAVAVRKSGRLLPGFAAYGLIALMVLWLGASSSMRLAVSYAKDGIQKYMAGDHAGAIANYETAVKLDHFNPEYKVYPRPDMLDLVKLYAQKGFNENNPYLIQQAVDLSREAVQQHKGESSTQWNLAQLLLSTGKIDEGLKTAEDAVKLAPMLQESYNGLAAMYVATAKNYLQAGNKEAAREVAGRALGVPRMIKDRVNSLTPEERALWLRGPMLAITPDLEKSLQEARSICGQK